MEETKSDSSEIDKKIEELQFSIKGLTEKIKVVSVESVIKSIEADILTDLTFFNRLKSRI